MDNYIPISQQPIEPYMKTLGTIYGSHNLSNTLNPHAIVNDNIDINPIAPEEKYEFHPSTLLSYIQAVNTPPRNMNDEARKVGLKSQELDFFYNWKKPIALVKNENTKKNPLYLGLPTWESDKYKNRSSYNILNNKPILRKNTELRTNRLY